MKNKGKQKQEKVVIYNGCKTPEDFAMLEMANAVFEKKKQEYLEKESKMNSEELRIERIRIERFINVCSI